MNMTLIGIVGENRAQMEQIKEGLRKTLIDLRGDRPEPPRATVMPVSEYTGGTLLECSIIRDVGRDAIDLMNELRDIIANEKQSGYEGAQARR